MRCNLVLEAVHIARTRAILAETYKKTELDVCKALIEHYVQVQKDSERALKEVGETIGRKLQHKAPEASATYKTFLKKCEMSEDNLRSLLTERRNKKFARLTPYTHTSSPHPYLRTHNRTPQTHSYNPQATTPRRKTLGPYPGQANKGKGPKRDENTFMPY